MARNLLSIDTSTNRRKQTGIDALYVRSNVVSIGSTVTSVAVVFSSAVPNASYTAVAVFRNTVDSSVQYQAITITAQSSSGFTASWNAPTGTANYELVYQTMGII